MNKFKNIAAAGVTSLSMLFGFAEPAAAITTPQIKCSVAKPSRRANTSFDLLMNTNRTQYTGKPFFFGVKYAYSNIWDGSGYKWEFYPNVPRSFNTPKQGRGWKIVEVRGSQSNTSCTSWKGSV